jgi:F420-dependent oxidoreductase-like protein
MTMKFGLFLPQGFGGELVAGTDPLAAYQTITATAQTADECGYETVWVVDHLHNAPGTQGLMFESWTTAAALARDTTRIRIGQLVTSNGYRNPALQAKMASTLDVIAGGRYTFGIGAGWWEPDYRGYGYAFPSASERLRRLDEAVQVIRALWTEDEASFDGEYYRVDHAINQPKGVQRPRIPMMIAGSGEKVMLKLVARYADACNVQGDPATIAHKYDVLRAHCESVGRDFDSIHRTAMTMAILARTDEEALAQVPAGVEAFYPGDVSSYGLIGSPATVARRIEVYAAAGVQELAIGLQGDLDAIRWFAKEFVR